MAKKKESPKKQLNSRVTAEVFKKVEKYAEQEGITTTTMAAELIAEAIENREGGARDQGDDTGAMLYGLLTKFDEQMTERIVTLNHNLRQATGMILIPKPDPEEVPPEELRIENSTDVKNWIESKFREIPLSD